MRNKKEFIVLYISIACFFLMSLSFLFMPIDTSTQNYKLVNALTGIFYWVFLILGCVTQVILSKMRKKWLIENRIKKYELRRQKIGMLSFMKNKYGLVADILLLVSIIGLIVASIVTEGIGYICYIFMATLVFSFCMHCILNGKIYYYLTNREKILKCFQMNNVDNIEKEKE